MYGEIIKFRADLGIGVIAAEDGRNYRFTKSEVVSSARDLVGENVDFIVDARRPRQIIVTVRHRCGRPSATSGIASPTTAEASRPQDRTAGALPSPMSQ